MTRTHRSPSGPRRGYSLLELQAAFVVFGFSMAALFPFAIAQLKLVSALERRMPPNTTYVVVSKDHGMVALLAAGNGTAAPSAGRSMKVGQVQPIDTGPMDMSTTVTVKTHATGAGGT